MKIQEIEIKKIRTNPAQARKEFDEKKLKELADSIKEVGILNPITVKKKGNVYEIVAGERRWAASKLAKLKTIPVIVREYHKKSSAVESLIENVHRKDLTSVEKENALYAIWKTGVYKTIKEMAKKVGMSSSIVGGILEAKEARKRLNIKSGNISTRDLRKTSSLSEAVRKKVLKKVEHGKLFSEQVEDYSSFIKKVPAAVQQAVLNDEITRKEAEDILGLDEKKQEAAILSIKRFKKIAEQIPKSIKKNKVFEKEKKTALDVINRLKSELNSTTSKMYKLSEVLDGFYDKKVFRVIPPDYKQIILDILTELKAAENALSISIKNSEEDLQ